MFELTVASVMTENVVTAVPATSFRELVATMAEHSVSAVPVVDDRGRPVGVVSEADILAKQEFHGGQDELPHHDRAGRLVGVVSRRDLLRVYLSDDEELRVRIAELLVTAGFAPGFVWVRVADGVATVDGEVAGQGQAIAVVRLVRAVPGVVGVHDNLRYPVDRTVWTGFRP